MERLRTARDKARGRKARGIVIPPHEKPPAQRVRDGRIKALLRRALMGRDLPFAERAGYWYKLTPDTLIVTPTGYTRQDQLHTMLEQRLPGYDPETGVISGTGRRVDIVG